jgi:hypothetical protein
MASNIAGQDVYTSMIKRTFSALKELTATKDEAALKKSNNIKR